MRARIYQPARTAMSSGQGKTKHWVLEFAASAPREVDPRALAAITKPERTKNICTPIQPIQV